MKPMTVYHSTSRSAKKQIDLCGHLADESWVTAEPITVFDKKQRKRALCLDTEAKGECACECRVPPNVLVIPQDGSRTCAGFSQFQLKTKVPITACRCRCEGSQRDVWFWLLGGIIVGIAAYGVYRLSASQGRN